MRSRRVVAAVLVALFVAVAGSTACGKGKGHHGHEAAHGAPEPPPPTPDFTPITLLRTPAGLVLQTEAEMPGATPPAAPTTPVAAVSPGVTP